MLHSKTIFPATILQVLLFISISFVCICGVFYFDSYFLVDYPLGFRMAFETVFFLLIPIVFFYLINYKNKPNPTITIKLPALNSILFGILGVVVIVSLSKGINSLLQPKQAIHNPYSIENAWMLLATCLLGPILEEVYFRLIIQDGLRQTYQPKNTILITALLFMLVHAPSQYPFAFIMGLLIGAVYYLTNYNILAAIILHLLANNLSTIFQFVGFSQADALVYYWALGIPSFIVFTYLGIKYVKKYRILFNRS